MLSLMFPQMWVTHCRKRHVLRARKQWSGEVGAELLTAAASARRPDKTAALFRRACRGQSSRGKDAWVHCSRDLILSYSCRLAVVNKVPEILWFSL